MSIDSAFAGVFSSSFLAASILSTAPCAITCKPSHWRFWILPKWWPGNRFTIPPFGNNTCLEVDGQRWQPADTTKQSNWQNNIFNIVPITFDFVFLFWKTISLFCFCFLQQIDPSKATTVVPSTLHLFVLRIETVHMSQPFLQPTFLPCERRNLTLKQHGGNITTSSFLTKKKYTPKKQFTCL